MFRLRDRQRRIEFSARPLPLVTSQQNTLQQGKDYNVHILSKLYRIFFSVGCYAIYYFIIYLI